MDRENMMIGIISYLPDNEKRKDRFLFVKKQYDWVSSLFNPSDCLFVAQNYKQNELFDYNNIVLSEGIGPSKARNLILERFYNSDFDWLLQLDDDVSIYHNYYEIEQLLVELNKKENYKKFKNIDMITGVFPRFQPFKHLNQPRDFIINNYTFIPRQINSPGNFIILRNIKKHQNNEIYYRNINLFKYEGREDMSYLMDFLIKGYSCYQCNQLIIHNFGEVKSCLFDYDVQSHVQQVSQCLDNFLDLYSDYLSRKINGNVDWSSFNKRYNKSRQLVTIPRGLSIRTVDDKWFIIKHRKQKCVNTKGLF